MFLGNFLYMSSNFEEFTKEELAKKLKKQKTIVIFQGFVIFLMIILAVVSSLDKGLNFQSFLPLFFVPMQFVMIFEMKKIKKALEMRK